MKTLSLFAAAAVALVPAVALAIPLPAPTYVKKAGASDLFEIESSRLVQNSSDPAVAQFASQMITDHGKSTADVTAAAQADGLTPGQPMLTPKQKAMIDGLKKTSGASRDRLYKKDQIAAHQETLAFQKQYATSGDKPNLKAAAGNIVPVVESHLSMIKDMSSAGARAQ